MSCLNPPSGASSSHEKRQVSAEGSSPHGKISLTFDSSVTRPTLDSCLRWSECHLQRNGESRTYLLHPETSVYFLRWCSTELWYMPVPCLVRPRGENKDESNSIKSWGSVNFQETGCYSASVLLPILLQIVVFSVWHHWYLLRKLAVQKDWSQHCHETFAVMDKHVI